MDEGSITSLIPQIILIFILVLVNAFFAAAEMAIVSVNKNKINMLSEEGNKKSILLQKLLKEPSNFLATIQIGITLAGFFVSASAATSISSYLSVWLESFNIPYSSKISVFLITVIMSYITLVLGELFPKRVALQQSETIALFAVKPIMFLSKITTPIVKFLSGSTNILVRIFGIKDDDSNSKMSREEIKSVLLAGKESGVINDTEEDMIHSIFDFDDTIAKEIMTPRTEVVLIDVHTPIDEINKIFIDEGFSRIPVYEDNTDNIIGVLYIKDLFKEITLGNKDIDIRGIMRSPYFAPETKNIDDLFDCLQKTKNHMAILIDEYGGFSGIATLEDIIEEVMGNIFDEYDDIEHQIKKIDEHTYLIDGLLPISEFNEHFDLNLESQTADTIGGFVLDLIGKVPTEEGNFSEKYENILFEVHKIDEKRIEELKVTFNKGVTN